MTSRRMMFLLVVVAISSTAFTSFDASAERSPDGPFARVHAPGSPITAANLFPPRPGHTLNRLDLPIGPSRATAPAATLTVNSTLDARDADPADGKCDAGGYACTLRAAIEHANAGTSFPEPVGTNAFLEPGP